MQFLRKDAGGARRAEGRAQQSVRVHRDQIQQDEGLADELGQHAGDVALAWLPSRSAVTPRCHRTDHRPRNPGAAARRAARARRRAGRTDPHPARRVRFRVSDRTEDCGW